MTHRSLVTLAVSALLLAGCSVGPDVVGIDEPPVQQTTVAPIPATLAQRIVDETLAASDAARTDDDLAAVETGAALRVSRAEATIAGEIKPKVDPAVFAADPAQVLAVSRGIVWPRHILATRLDKDANIQYLYVLVSRSVEDPYRVRFIVPMEGGASIPALGAIDPGAPVVFGGDGLIAPPSEVVRAYGEALAHPKPKESDLVDTSDRLAKGLRTVAEQQVKTLGKLGSFTETHEIVPDETVSFQLLDGGAISFGQLTRTDTITLTKEAKELVLPEVYEKLAKKKSVKSKVTITSLETVVLLVPETGRATLIGADEQLVSVEGE